LLRILTIVGARPQFIKAGALSRAIALHNAAGNIQIQEKIVHTGQHYDHNMSRVFFEELSIPEPDYNLEIGSASHGRQTGCMLERLENVFLTEKPDVVVVYGDTNSTLAGALAAAKLHIPVAHIEAGLRSFNKKMPEEVNRVLTDHVSHFLFCPTQQAIDNLMREGIVDRVYSVGDIMYDSMCFYLVNLGEECSHFERYGLYKNSYVLATIHRAENTDNESKLAEIFLALELISDKYPVVLTLHPRTRERMDRYCITSSDRIHILEPVSYLEMIKLECNAFAIVTDSGGVQKEAFFVQRPCITLREETEWVETVSCGANILCGTSCSKIVDAFALLSVSSGSENFAGEPYGDGQSSKRILNYLLNA